MHENRTIVMLADSPQEVDFYLAKDEYPVSYITKWTAK